MCYKNYKENCCVLHLWSYSKNWSQRVMLERTIRRNKIKGKKTWQEFGINLFLRVLHSFAERKFLVLFCFLPLSYSAPWYLLLAIWELWCMFYSDSEVCGFFLFRCFFKSLLLVFTQRFIILTFTDTPLSVPLFNTKQFLSTAT